MSNECDRVKVEVKIDNPFALPFGGVSGMAMVYRYLSGHTVIHGIDKLSLSQVRASIRAMKRNKAQFNLSHGFNLLNITKYGRGEDWLIDRADMTHYNRDFIKNMKKMKTGRGNSAE